MLLTRGAEAEIHLTTWLGREAIAKLRVPKIYRDKKIDKELRRDRTKSEAKLIHEVKKYDVPTPVIYEINPDECKLVMEYIKGKRIKELLGKVSSGARKKLCTQIGESIGRMHAQHIIHGDLTTSNMIRRNHGIYFIDFGLGEKNNSIEVKGVDLHVLMEAFKSAHSEIYETLEHVLAGYKNYKRAEEVIEKAEEIAERGRYV